jgi:hypothetical protein
LVFFIIFAIVFVVAIGGAHLKNRERQRRRAKYIGLVARFPR